ncbi:MAG: hypothetical protein BroJett003_12240 [Planctomycetota bacterium]|nr:MAG: hypothetical protein BroJett003_12240 [Planctomycetota bacterium]
MRFGPITNLLTTAMTLLCPAWCVVECAAHCDKACEPVVECGGYDGDAHHGPHAPHHQHDSGGQPEHDAEHTCICTTAVRTAGSSGGAAETQDRVPCAIVESAAQADAILSSLERVRASFSRSATLRTRYRPLLI